VNDAVITNAVIAAVDQRSQAVQAFIMHHMADSHRWSLLPHLHQSLPRYLSLHGVMVILAAIALVYFMAVVCRTIPAVPTGLLNLVEFFVQFIRDEIAVPFLGEEDGRRMTPVLCSLFFFILTMNLIGLVPCFYTATSNINVTGAMAVVTLVFMTVGAMWKHGPVGFVRGFVPSGVPWPILFILVPIEMVGLVIKAFALMIRLFANELAGHVVVFSLLGLVVMFGAVALPAMGMAMGIYILETFVAFLQAYIFTLLSALFIGQRYHPSH
jgi:F-type H+-transporting ATPase subunit a